MDRGIETNQIEVSVVMPCLNEEQTIGICIDKALESFERHNIRGEVVVADNGSTDNSVEITVSKGARVVHQTGKGYGNAYRKGISMARGKYVVMADSDNTYDFGQVNEFVGPLRNGYDFVIGTRLKGKILKGSMPALHRYIGNPLLSGILRIMFRAKISDAHCGMRAFTQEAYQRMHLITTGMEFASEMAINAVKAGLKIEEIPITYYPREGESKLRSFPDGWRHLRFMLLYSPTYLFIIPGLVFFVLGLALMMPLLFGPVIIGGRTFDIHCMIMGGLFNIVGLQVIMLGLLAKAYSFTEKFEERDRIIEFFYRHFNLERTLVLGGLYLLAGLLCILAVVGKWAISRFGPLDEPRMIFFGVVIVVNAFQIIFSSFLLSMMHIKTRRTPNGVAQPKRQRTELTEKLTKKE